MSNNEEGYGGWVQPYQMPPPVSYTGWDAAGSLIGIIGGVLTVVGQGVSGIAWRLQEHARWRREMIAAQLEAEAEAERRAADEAAFEKLAEGLTFPLHGTEDPDS